MIDFGDSRRLNAGISILFAALAFLSGAGTARAEWCPGLRGGFVAGNSNLTDFPAVTNVYLSPEAAATNGFPPWADNTTWVYWGQMHFNGGTYFFAENIDDGSFVRVDGVQVLSDNTYNTVAVSSPALTLPAGWYDVEFRFRNGTGGAGPSGQAGWTKAYGLGYNDCGVSSKTQADYTFPIDDGAMSLFRHDDGLGFTKTLQISGLPSDIGVVAPAYGITNGLVSGAVIACSASSAVVDGVHYRCRGYVLEEADSGGAWVNAATNLGVASFAYVHGTNSARLTWLWEADGYRLDVASYSDGAGTFSLSPAPDLGDGCYSAGTTVTLTATPSGEAPFSWWLGDVPDAQRGQNPVALVMDAPRTVQGAFGGGWIQPKNVVHFVPDGKAGAITTGKRIVAGTNSFTLATWVKLAPEKIVDYAPIMCQDGDTIPMYQLYYQKSTGEYVFRRRTGWTSPTSDYTRVTAPTNGVWTHLAAVYDKDAHERRIYLDGTLVASSPDTYTTAPTKNFRIGYWEWSSFFYGYLAEMSVWNYALDGTKIQKIMRTRPEGGDLDGCIAYWPFDEGDGGTICRDISAEVKITSATIPNASKIVLGSVDDFPEFYVWNPVISYSVTVNHPDFVDVTENTTPDQGTRYSEGSTASYTASSAAATFVRWYGDVPENQVSNATINVVVGKDMSLSPYFVPDGWIYDSSASTISNGYWVLNVARSGTELSVASVKSLPVVGILDLAAPVDGGAYSIVKLNSGAFSSRKTIEEVSLPDTLRTIDGSWYDNGAFYNCTALKSVTPFLPDSVNVIGCYAFADCTSLGGDLVLNGAGGDFRFVLGAYHRNYFMNTKITSADLGTGVTNVPFNTFSGCAALTNITFRGAVEAIEANAFKNCAELRTVTPLLPDSLVSLGANAFDGCAALVGNLALNNPSLTLLSNHAFRNTKISGAAIPHVEQIGVGDGCTFADCAALTNIVLSTALTNIAQASFKNCTALRDLWFRSKPAWTSTSFSGWTNYQARIHLPVGDSDWEAFIADPEQMTPWGALDATARGNYEAAFPGGKRPKGLSTAATNLKKQWILGWDPSGWFSLLIMR